VLDPNLARAQIEMMKSVLESGTASSSLGRFPRPAAGKTGTTDQNVDAWFVGFTPQYTAAVWMGNPDGEVPMKNLPIGPVFGATYPAQIWREFMLGATEKLPPLDFAPPDEQLLPRSSYITEEGRRFSFRGRGSYTPPVTIDPATTQTTVGNTPTTRKRTTPTSEKPTPTTAGPPPTTAAPSGP
jgi:membrane peptidoglycan carboxypeptidase